MNVFCHTLFWGQLCRLSNYWLPGWHVGDINTCENVRVRFKLFFVFTWTLLPCFLNVSRGNIWSAIMDIGCHPSHSRVGSDGETDGWQNKLTFLSSHIRQGVTMLVTWWPGLSECDMVTRALWVWWHAHYVELATNTAISIPGVWGRSLDLVTEPSLQHSLDANTTLTLTPPTMTPCLMSHLHILREKISGFPSRSTHSLN